MKAHELLERTDIYPRLSKLFPEFVTTAKSITIIPWQESFQIADENPEIIDTLEYYRKLLADNIIAEEQYITLSNKINSGKVYASRTEGIAFMYKNEIAFRSPTPDTSIIIHEIGHVHYQEPDPIWSAAYGGGEALMAVGLWKDYTLYDEDIKAYHKILHDAEVSPQEVGDALAKTIVSKLNMSCYPHLYTIMLLSGIIPNGLFAQLHEKSLEEIYDELENPQWSKVEVTSSNIRMFKTDLIEGLKCDDSFCAAYAKALGLIR